MPLSQPNFHIVSARMCYNEPMYGYGYDSDGSMLLLYIAIIAVVALSFYAQGKVKRTFMRYKDMPAARGVRACDMVRALLGQNGASTEITAVSGTLTDHYNPQNDTVGLSTEVYGSTSVAALAIAAHETGHVLQHQEGYLPIRIRNAILPAANIGSQASPFIVLIGLLINSYTVAIAGALLYGAMLLFQVVTLPVELNASRRALSMLEAGGYVADGEQSAAARKVLRAAAMTYVLAALGSLLNFLRLLMLARRTRRR